MARLTTLRRLQGPGVVFCVAESVTDAVEVYSVEARVANSPVEQERIQVLDVGEGVPLSKVAVIAAGVRELVPIQIHVQIIIGDGKFDDLLNLRARRKEL